VQGEALQQSAEHLAVIRPVQAGQLAAVLVPGRHGEHLVAARSAGHLREGGGT